MKGEPLQILLIVCFSICGACFAQSTYYVTPTPDTPCPGSEEPCHTLSEYIANGSFKNLPMSTTILFLPGNHTLETTIPFENLKSLAVLGASSSLPEVTSRIFCTWPAGFAFTDIIELHINALAFMSCGHNDVGAINVTSVEQSHFCRCTFESNYAADNGGVGGAIAAWYSSIRLTENKFHNNSAFYSGASIFTRNGTLDLTMNTFLGNFAEDEGGALTAIGGTLYLTTNIFLGNSAPYGGAIAARLGTLNINTSTFYDNSAYQGGAIDAVDMIISLSTSAFLENSAEYAGGAFTVIGGTLYLTTNTILVNSAHSGGAIKARIGTLHITTNTFLENSADYGGAITAPYSTLHLTSNTFHNNIGYIGGALHAFSSAFMLTGNTFRKNFAQSSGGALAAYRSTVHLTTALNKNNACGAAEDVCELDHHLTRVGKVSIDSNRAKYGGGLYMVNTTVSGNAMLTENSAIEGGAVFAYRGMFLFNDTTTIANNSAIIGGGLLLSEDSKLNLPSDTAIHFINNTASETGGAVHVKTVNRLELCTEELAAVYKYWSDCFFQIKFTNKQPHVPKNTSELRQFIQSLNISLQFENNSAQYAGIDLYGGLVDSCLLSSIERNQAYYTFSYSGVVFDIITRGESKPKITSDPLRFCICTDHCNVHRYSQSVYPGGTVEVPVTALGQRNQPTIATIHVCLHIQQHHLEIL